MLTHQQSTLHVTPTTSQGAESPQSSRSSELLISGGLQGAAPGKEHTHCKHNPAAWVGNLRARDETRTQPRVGPRSP